MLSILRPFVVGYLALASAAIASSSTMAVEPFRKHNILLIVTDDQRPDTIGALGNGAIHTPALDRLVREGTTFTRCICGYPICVASRAEMLTGCTAFRALAPYPAGKLNDSLPLLPGVLQQAGYRTLYVGKWHTTGRPTERGYHVTRGLFASGGSLPLTIPLDRFGKPNTGYRGWLFQDDQGRKFADQGVGLTPNISEAFADAAVALIDEHRDQPFFLHVNFTAPHDPRLTPRNRERHERSLPPLPKNFVAEHPFDHGNAGGRDEMLLPRPLAPQVVREETAIYYSLVEHLDAQVGRLLDKLREVDRLHNTIVVFTSDHGLALGSHGLTGKQNMYEHTIGVPLLMMGPGIPVGRRIAAPCYLRDLFPTFCELTGTNAPPGLDGRSLRPLLTDESRQLYAFVVGYFTDTQRMIRTERWKYVRYPQIDREQLFDLAADPDELRDLIGEPQHRKVVAELAAQLTQWLSEHGDPLTKND